MSEYPIVKIPISMKFKKPFYVIKWKKAINVRSEYVGYFTSKEEFQMYVGDGDNNYVDFDNIKSVKLRKTMQIGNEVRTLRYSNEQNELVSILFLKMITNENISNTP